MVSFLYKKKAKVNNMLKLTVLMLFAASSWALYSSNLDVIQLTPTNFAQLVIKGDEIWIVQFFAPWCQHCQAFSSEYAKAAIALKGIIKMGVVNGDLHGELTTRYDVHGFPTIKIFGENKSKPKDYTGARTAQGLVDHALHLINARVKSSLGGKSSSSDVIELTDSNFDEKVLLSKEMWLVEFFAPWCGHCQNLAPHWAKAATELKGKVKLGAIDATIHQTKASKYGVRGYPTIKVFPAGKKTFDSVFEYDGEHNSNDIVSWVMEKLAENVPAPDIIQIVNLNVLKKACADKHVCIVAVLPHILDCQSECRNKYLNILKEVGEKYKKNIWGWVWSEGGIQTELEKALDIGGFGYPAMAVVNLKKMKYSILRGAFTKDGINEFLKELSRGHGTTFPVKKQELPKIVSIEPWDGKDGELPQEEDIDLSDIELDKKDEL